VPSGGVNNDLSDLEECATCTAWDLSRDREKHGCEAIPRVHPSAARDPCRTSLPGRQTMQKTQTPY